MVQRCPHGVDLTVLRCFRCEMSDPTNPDVIKMDRLAGKVPY